MYYIYIVECSDKTLYTGYTTDIKRRIQTHNKGKGAKYTKARLPVKLVYFEEFSTKTEALKREYQIKRFSRKQKLELIKTGDSNVLSHFISSGSNSTNS